ncbi:MAG TPA: DUF5050 domain-containing protein [Polyangiaceae bacterium]
MKLTRLHARLFVASLGVSACGRSSLLDFEVAPPPDASSPLEAGVDANVGPPCPGQSDGVVMLADVEPSFSPATENQAIAAADGYVYWVANGFGTGSTMGAVFRVPRCGGPVTILADNQIDPVTVAVSGGYVYWTTTGDHNTGTAIGTLMRAPVSGGSPTQLAMGPAVFSYYFTVDSEYVYSTAFDDNFGAWRMPLSGGARQDITPNNQWIFHTIVVDSARAYMTAPGTKVNYLVSVPIGGGDGDVLLMNKIPFPGLLAEDERYLYFPTTDNTLERLNKDGSSPLTLASGLQPTALAVDGQSAYVSMNAGDSSDGIYSIPTAGGAMTTLSTKGGVALAVDDDYAYWLDYQSHVYRVRK